MARIGLPTHLSIKGRRIGRQAQMMAMQDSMIVQMEAFVDVQVVSALAICLRYGTRMMDTMRML
jgi:hypothetical protein